MGAVEVHQCLGAGGPEAVDALVLVPHQKEIAGAEQVDDGVLDAGGVLSLVHAEVAAALLEMGEDLGVAPQDLQGVDHLVIVVHQGAVPEGLVVGLVDLREVIQGFSKLLDALLGQHLVFGVSDGGLDGLDVAVRGEVLCNRSIDLPDQGGGISLVAQKIKGLAAAQALIIVNDSGGKAVDGAKFHPLRQLGAEDGGKACLHIPGGGNGVGHRQDGFQGDTAAKQHISKPGHKNRRFAAARHRQQKDRPLHGPDGRILLGIQSGGVFAFECFIGHGKTVLQKVKSHCTTSRLVFPHPS